MARPGRPSVDGCRAQAKELSTLRQAGFQAAKRSVKAAVALEHQQRNFQVFSSARGQCRGIGDVPGQPVVDGEEIVALQWTVAATPEAFGKQVAGEH